MIVSNVRSRSRRREIATVTCCKVRNCLRTASRLGNFRQIPLFVSFRLGRDGVQHRIRLDVLGGLSLKLGREGISEVILPVRRRTVELTFRAMVILNGSGTLGLDDLGDIKRLVVILLCRDRLKRSALKYNLSFFGLLVACVFRQSPT